jgi:two-component system chemotaxis response regulator CheY
MKMLIVDDSLIVRNAIHRVADQHGITEILEAGNGEDALDLFLRYNPELVTMDLTMPKVDGLKCLEQIAALGIKSSIMVISALNSHSTAMKAIEMGACGFIVKPFTNSELSEALAELVEHARGETQT